MDRILTGNEGKIWTSSGGDRFDTLVKAGVPDNGNKSSIDIIIQNNSVNPMFIKMGLGASSSDFDFILRGCFVDDDGTGGILSLTGISLLQPISAFSLNLLYTYSFR